MRRTEIRALTVSDYASRIGAAVRNVGAAVIEGEVQRPHTSRGRLLYFDLTDGEAKLCCKVFRRDVAALQHTPNAGDLVQVQVDRPDLWSVAGKLDLIVSGVKLAGEGELLRRRAALIDQLTREGLCDPARWKPLPTFPRAVGVIAGKGSDGRSDVIRALQDRFPPTRIVCCDAVVQGKSAPRDIIDAIAHLQRHPLVDVVLIARGGGSVQDLIAFDDERLCRAVFACGVPVITAIGHTGNTPVCNHITHAASTPSRSAELVVPSAAELRQGIVYASQTNASGPGGRHRPHPEVLLPLRSPPRPPPGIITGPGGRPCAGGASAPMEVALPPSANCTPKRRSSSGRGLPFPARRRRGRTSKAGPPSSAPPDRRATATTRTLNPGRGRQEVGDADGSTVGLRDEQHGGHRCADRLLRWTHPVGWSWFLRMRSGTGRRRLEEAHGLIV